MPIERTLAIVKPDAVAKNVIGKILSRIEENHLQLIAVKMMHLTREEAENFYAIHRERPFFKALVSFISSGPVLIAVLQGENAIAKYRDLMGATNPKDAKPGTLRAEFADSIDENAVHGSDSVVTAKEEIAFFFNEDSICDR